MKKTATLKNFNGKLDKLCSQASKHILIQNLYFPKPGKEKEVYEWRLHASDVRVKLGLRKGRVLKRINISDRPYVIWECDFSSTEDRKNDVKVLSKSKEFKKVQEYMGTLLNHFEQWDWETND